ncbi:MAG: long-chain fatty acid--CoA ligase [Acidobacteria bacterium]|jgi:Long-chain acyl-CoA synthetases (AMP-forming)|nr:AMP-binding protein [Acidobacteriota bacterium]MDD8030190.1 AMP-binding protein [Acidobacteriota bacterium]MDW3227101.1 AMP-binding protein [Acidobacteriota bacterium]NMD09595.1 long-chain fatty acid--CoA ligase [Acidobacteriota bacterium]
MEHKNELTIPAILAKSAELYENRNALGFYDSPALSYRQLKDKTDQIAAFLADRGIVHGDRVAILSENSPHWGVAYLAVTSMGAVAVPILTDFSPTEIHHVLRHSEAKAVFVSEKLYGKIDEASFDHLKTRILIDDFSVIKPDTSKDKLRRLIAEGSHELRKIKAMALKWLGRIPSQVQSEDLASIIYTSGTTGHSKGVMLTHGNLVSDVLATTRLVDVNCEDRLLSLLPLAHVYECTLGLITSLMKGASVSYVHKPPTAAVLLPALRAVQPTFVLSVPLIIEKMVRAKVFPALRGKALIRMACAVPALRKMVIRKAGAKIRAAFGGKLNMFCIGGAALAPDVEDFLIEAGFPYCIGYGLTETAPLVTGTKPFETRPRSAGRPLEGVEIRIADPDPKTGEGEIQLRGPMIMKGYYKDPEKTAEAFSDGWLKTGDLGCLDADGFLYIKGRSKNVIIGPSGENIYPEVIESVINRTDSVQESLVFEEQGRLVARIHLNYEALDAFFSEKKWSASQIREHIRRLLEDIKAKVNEGVASFSRLSRVIEQTEPFEKTPTQKIKRYLYVERTIDGEGAISV